MALREGRDEATGAGANHVGLAVVLLALLPVAVAGSAGVIQVGDVARILRLVDQHGRQHVGGGHVLLHGDVEHLGGAVARHADLGIAALEGGHEAVLGHLHHGTGIVGHVLGLDDLEGCRLVESARDTEGVALVNGLLGGVEQLLLAGLLLGRERRKLRRDLVLGQGAVVDGQLVDDAVEAVAADQVDRDLDAVLVVFRPGVEVADLLAVDVHGHALGGVLGPRDAIPGVGLEVALGAEGQHVAVIGTHAQAAVISAVGVTQAQGECILGILVEQGQALLIQGTERLHPVGDGPALAAVQVHGLVGQRDGLALGGVHAHALAHAGFLERGSLHGAVVGTGRDPIIGGILLEAVVRDLGGLDIDLRNLDDGAGHGDLEAGNHRVINLGSGGYGANAGLYTGHDALGRNRGDIGVGRAPHHATGECGGGLELSVQLDALIHGHGVRAGDGDSGRLCHGARGVASLDEGIGELVQAGLEGIGLGVELLHLGGGQVLLGMATGNGHLVIQGVDLVGELGCVALHEHDLVHVAHALGHALEAQRGLGGLHLGGQVALVGLDGLLVGAGVHQEAIARLERPVRRVVQRVICPSVVGPAQETGGALLAGVDHRPVALDGRAQREVARSVTGAGVQRGAQARVVAHLEELIEGVGLGERDVVAHVEVIHAHGQRGVADVVHGARGLERLALGVLHGVDQVESLVREAALVDAHVRVVEPTLLFQVLDHGIEEVAPELVAGRGAHGGAVHALELAVLPVLDSLVLERLAVVLNPRRDAVEDDLIADAQLLVELDPLVEVREVVVHRTVLVHLPTHHRRVVDLLVVTGRIVVGVGLPLPSLLGHRSGDGMAAQLLVESHDGLEDLEVLGRERLYAVVLGGSIRILPQLDIEGVLELRRIGKLSVLHLEGIGELQGLGHAGSAHGDLRSVGAGLGILGNVDLHEHVLQRLRVNGHGSVAQQDVADLLAVPAIVGVVATGLVAPAQERAVVGLGGTDEGQVHVLGCDDVARLGAEVARCERDALDALLGRSQDDLGNRGIVLPGGELAGEAALADAVQRLAVAILGPLGVDIGDEAVDHRRLRHGDGDLEGAHGELAGGLGTHRDDGLAAALGRNGTVLVNRRDLGIARNEVEIGVGDVVRRGRKRNLGLAALPQREAGGTGRSFELGGHIRLVAHDHLGAVDARVAGAGALGALARGLSAQDMRTFTQVLERRDLRARDISLVIQTVGLRLLVLRTRVDGVGHRAHGMVLARVDIDRVANERDLVPHVFSLEAGRRAVGPHVLLGAGAAQRRPPLGRETEEMTLSLQLGVRDRRLDKRLGALAGAGHSHNRGRTDDGEAQRRSEQHASLPYTIVFTHTYLSFLVSPRRPLWAPYAAAKTLYIV